MRKTTFLFISILSLISCNNRDKEKEFPKPGTTIASAEMPINDPLNKFTFAVKVIADSNIKDGVYDVDVDYGPNFAEGKFTMPKGGEDFKPIIRKGTTPYTYIIGFNVAGDTTFYDYFEVSSSRTNTKIQYIKSYTF